MQQLRWVVSVLLCCAVMVSCSDSGTEPVKGPSLTIMRGSGITDTIGAILSQELVVEVRGKDGKLEPDVEVVFDGAARTGPGTPSAVVAVAPLGASYFQTTRMATKTDGKGRAIVRTAFGHIAGKASVIVKVPAYEIEDSAAYIISPGSAVAVQVLPREKAIVVGAKLALSAAVIDRTNNLRDDPLTFEALGNAIVIDDSGMVEGVAIGRAYARVQAEVNGRLLKDSIAISVVPSARIAVNAGYFDGLIITDLTGENSKKILHGQALAPDWSPGREQIVYVSDGRMGVTDTLGNATFLPTAGIHNPTWPQYSADGQWIYFHGEADGAVRLYRIQPDGTGLEPIAGAGLAGAYPSPAPDGASIAFKSSTGEPGIKVFEFATQAVRTLPNTESARIPRWSPDGQWIAYSSGYSGNLTLIRPDGTDQYEVDSKAGESISWSPDSRWIIAGGGYDGVRLVNVETREAMIIPPGYEYVSWRP